jgi:hypothetical protein
VIVLAALRRFFVLLVLASVVTIGVALFFALLASSSFDRAISVGFYLAGSFLLVGGFFVGNRGPVRLKDPNAAVSFVPFWGTRVVRWATPDEREDAINTSAIFVALGLALILIGVAADSRYALF